MQVVCSLFLANDIHLLVESVTSGTYSLGSDVEVQVEVDFDGRPFFFCFTSLTLTCLSLLISPFWSFNVCFVCEILVTCLVIGNTFL